MGNPIFKGQLCFMWYLVPHNAAKELGNVMIITYTNRWWPIDLVHGQINACRRVAFVNSGGDDALRANVS